MPAKKMYRATVHILVEAEGENEACDIISGHLTESGIYAENTGIVDWSYESRGAEFIGPREVVVPGRGYDRDEDTPQGLSVAA